MQEIDLSGLPDNVDLSGLPDKGDDVHGSVNMTPEEMSRTGQLYREPSTVTAGVEPTKFSEALRANVQPMLEHPIEGLGRMFTDWGDVGQAIQNPLGPTAKRALGMPVSPEEDYGSQNFYNTGVLAAMMAVPHLFRNTGVEPPNSTPEAPTLDEAVKAGRMAPEQPEAPQADAQEAPQAPSEAFTPYADRRFVMQPERAAPEISPSPDIEDILRGLPDKPQKPSAQQAARSPDLATETARVGGPEPLRLKDKAYLQDPIVGPAPEPGAFRAGIEPETARFAKSTEGDNVQNELGALPELEKRPAETRSVGEPYGQRIPSPEQAASMEASGESSPSGSSNANTGTSEGISVKNAYTDAQRAKYGFADAVKEAAKSLDKSWSEAEETLRQNPIAGARLVERINDGQVRSLDDHDVSLLLREQIDAQTERNAAADAVNSASAAGMDLTESKARLAVANARVAEVFDADLKAGTAQGRGLRARQMVAKEDYSLDRMRARKRAANNGQITANQLKQTDALHAKIDELQKRIDKMQSERPNPREVKATAKTKRFTDFMDEQAQKARERLIAKRGRLNAGIDPTNIVDEAIIGASHIARGLTKFADWSAQMIKDFGDRVKPYLRQLYEQSRAYHDQAKNLESYKNRMASEMVGYKAKIERGDFTKQAKSEPFMDAAAYKMKANLQKLKNEFERGVAKDAYNKMSPGDKFWQHFVGVERAMKLSSPAVFEKLGIAGAIRESLAPVESAGGYLASKVFPKLARGTRYGADLKTLTGAEVKAKVALFTEGMKDAWQNMKGKETELEAMSDKYGRQPDFWYHRIGKIHAAVKAPIKRAEFTRSLEQRMNAAVRAGEDINRPQVMDRLATEAALDANRAIFQQNTVVSKFFSTLDKQHPVGARVARFLFPVVKIPVNLFKEFVTYNVGTPTAAIKIGRAYWKGVETLPALEREAIIRQLVKGSVGGAALLWGYYNSDKIHDLFKKAPPVFEHTPIAMAIHEGSLIKQLQKQGAGTKFRTTEAWKDTSRMARYDIPFVYTVSGIAGALDPSNPNGWSGWRDYLNGMIQGTVVPQASAWLAKEIDKPKPFSPASKPYYRPPQNPLQAVEAGIPVIRRRVPGLEFND